MSASFPSRLTNTTFIFLHGDSYPNAFMEEALRERLPGRLLGQGQLARIYGGDAATIDLDTRLNQLRQAVDTLLPENVVLIGRSSGARVVSLLATERPAIRAAICLGYPFRHPDKGPEPDRYKHLSGISVPTLIIQGDQDAYGDAITARTYSLSPAARLEFISTDHAMRISNTSWDYINRRICHFLFRNQSI